MQANNFSSSSERLMFLKGRTSKRAFVMALVSCVVILFFGFLLLLFGVVVPLWLGGL